MSLSEQAGPLIDLLLLNYVYMPQEKPCFEACYHAGRKLHIYPYLFLHTKLRQAVAIWVLRTAGKSSSTK